MTFKKIDLEWLYWFAVLGLPKRKISSIELMADLNNKIERPIFFLSTGRCGTKWFTVLLKKDKKNAVFHNITPTFARQSKFIYSHYVKNDFSLENEIHGLLREMFLVGREGALRYTYKTEKRYIETNNYITFFAPVLAETFPDASFVMLYRNPLEFIRSAYSRDYYNDKYENDRRLYPVKDREQWEKLNQLEKIAWLWNETYTFIIRFAEVYKIKLIKFNFNELTFENVSHLLSELSVHNIKDRHIRRLLPQKINSQKEIRDKVQEKISENLDSIRKICGETAEKLGYTI